MITVCTPLEPRTIAKIADSAMALSRKKPCFFVKIGTRSLGQCWITTHIAATRMIARSAPSPSSPAPSARRYAALGLDRSARPSKGDTMPQMRAGRCSPVLKIHARQTTSDRSSAGFLNWSRLSRNIGPPRRRAASVRQWIGPHLDVHGARLTALATFLQPWRAVAVRAPQPAALPAGIRVVDPPVQPFGKEARRVRDAQHYHLS